MGHWSYRTFGNDVTRAFQPSAAELVAAIERREFALVYQPQVAAGDLTIAGAEALVRWQHPVRGMLGPGAFIDAVEATGLMDAVGAYVLERACHEAAHWPLPLPVAVNISPTHFSSAQFALDVKRALGKSGLEPARLEIEVVESVAFQSLEEAKECLKQLHDHGVSVAMDDFGAGYASLSVLQAMPFDKIKIDKVFIDGIPNIRSVAILQATVALIRALGMKVTAEGVENSEQERFLKASGVHYLQGFRYSRPLTNEKLVARMRLEPSFRYDADFSAQIVFTSRL